MSTYLYIYKNWVSKNKVLTTYFNWGYIGSASWDHFETNHVMCGTMGNVENYFEVIEIIKENLENSQQTVKLWLRVNNSEYREINFDSVAL